MANKNSDLTKRHLAALEKLFAAEIENRTPVYSRAKIYIELQTLGCVEFVERRLRGFRDGLGDMIVRGWALTPRGHLLYCESCSEVTDG